MLVQVTDQLRVPLVIVAPFILVAVATPRDGVTKVGEARFALRFNAVCCAVETGFAVSEVLSTFASHTAVLFNG